MIAASTNKKTGWSQSDRPVFLLVEAAGIEPASQARPRQASTCVFGRSLCSPSRGPTDGAQERQPGSVSPFEHQAGSRGLLLDGVGPDLRSGVRRRVA